jgi:hypothetical protein
MENEMKIKHVHHNNGSFVGGLWFAGWLFSLGFLQLIWWKALLALVIWPYYLGLALR